MALHLAFLETFILETFIEQFPGMVDGKKPPVLFKTAFTTNCACAAFDGELAAPQHYVHYLSMR